MNSRVPTSTLGVDALTARVKGHYDPVGDTEWVRLTMRLAPG